MVDILTFDEFLNLPINSKVYKVCQGEITCVTIVGNGERSRIVTNYRENFKVEQIYSEVFSKKISHFQIEDSLCSFSYPIFWFSTFDPESIGKTMMLQGNQIIREAAREMLKEPNISIEIILN